MVKCNKGQLRRLKRALRGRRHPAMRQRIQMVLLRESGMTQPAIAVAMGVSLSTVNRAHMAYPCRVFNTRSELAKYRSGQRIAAHAPDWQFARIFRRAGRY